MDPSSNTVDGAPVDVDMLNALPSSPPSLFSDVKFAVFGLPPIYDDDPGFHDHLRALEEKGGQRVNLPSGNPEDEDEFKTLSHIISKTSDFKVYEQAIDHFIHVVTPTWIVISAAKDRQQNPRQHSPDPAMFLSDVILSCADIPTGDAEAIAGGVLAMGGLVSEQLTKVVTHLVALSPEDPKVVAAMKKGLCCEIIIPHWFDDCLRLGRRLSEQAYRLPNPEYLNYDQSNPPKAVNNKDIDTAMMPTPMSPPPSSALAKENLATVFKSHKVFLSKDLDISQRTVSTIKDIIQNGGGEVCETVNQADMVVCQFRDGDFFKAVRKKNIEIGNLSWLYHLILRNSWTNPKKRLLHYPVPRHGIPGFENFMVSLSNYTGNARIYLENLIRASGAKFTKTMVQQNTHLITAHRGSEKCDAAMEWNIHIVNHLWLEDSYAQFREQSLTVNKYSHFPNRTNLGEIVGQTPIDNAAVEKFYGSNQGTRNGRDSDGDVSRATSSDYVSAANHRVSEQPARPGAADQTPSTRPQRRGQSDVHITPILRKLADGKENEFLDITSTGSRASKARAFTKLHAAAQDIALYEKEKKRVGGVTHGRDRMIRASSSAGPEGASSPKRKMTEETSDDSDGDIDSTARVTKRAKVQVNIQKSGKIKMIVSMYPRWLEKPQVEQADKNKLRNLGIHVIDEPTSGGFILCAPRLARTKKFVCALAYGPDVVSSEFIDHCLQHKRVPDIDDFILEDTEGEKKMQIILADSISRAQKNNRKLLKGWQVFCTEKIPGGFNTYKDIIEANGGSCHLFKNKTLMSVPKNKLSGEEDDELFLVSGNSAEEKKLWVNFQTLAKNAEMRPRIVRSDWLLSIAMRQKIYWADEWLHVVK